MDLIVGRMGSSALKIVIYGPEGIGKSTFASKFPKPLFIDTEDSTKFMDVVRTPRPSSWVMLLSQVAYVKANPSVCKTLIIDTADWAEALCIIQVCSRREDVKGIEDFGYGKGYTYLAEEFGKLLNALTEIIDLGINVVVTAHAQMRKFEQPDEMGAYDRWELKLQKKTAPLLKEWADMVLFANYETIVTNVDGQGAVKGKNKAQGGRRVMNTTHHVSWDAKNRFGLPEKADFDYSVISNIIAQTGTSVPVASVPATEAMTPPPVTPPVSTTTVITPPAPPVTETEKKIDPEPAEILNQEIEKMAAEGGFKLLPTALTDLMTANNVTETEIQLAVNQRGYYPKDTPIANYDPQFINGVLIAAWPQVFQMIKNNK